jgi:hypothetical protein
MNRIHYLTLLIIIFSISCSTKKLNSEDESHYIALSNEEAIKFQERLDSIHYERDKKLYPSATLTLLSINGDTLIASTYDNGLILTIDAGKTWNRLNAPDVPIYELTIDKQKRIWALFTGGGIHEKRVGAMLVSSDLGLSWAKYDSHTEQVFPAKIYSKPNDSLKVIDDYNMIYQLNTYNKIMLDWTLIDSLPINTYQESKDYIHDKKGRKWLYGTGGIFLIDGDTIKVY